MLAIISHMLPLNQFRNVLRKAISNSSVAISFIIPALSPFFVTLFFSVFSAHEQIINIMSQSLTNCEWQYLSANKLFYIMRKFAEIILDV